MRTISDTLLQIEDLSVEPQNDRGREALIEGFALTVRAGEVIGLVGETGAGKSLSMRAAVGLLPDAIRPVSGQVAFAKTNTPIVRPDRLRLNLGHGICLLLQNGRGALNPYKRVHQQVERILKSRRVPRRERATIISNLLDSVGLPASEFAQRYPHQLSGGQAQRVAMVIALATDPKLLIADEPTTALDVTSERDVIDLLKRLCRERDMGLVLITHNLGLVANTCDRVVLMHAGHVVESGPTASIFDNPQHPYTQALLQAIPDVDVPHELVPLTGAVPARGTMGSGCRFVTRCSLAWEKCRHSVPPPFAVDNHQSRCWLHAAPQSQPPALAAVNGRGAVA